MIGWGIFLGILGFFAWIGALAEWDRIQPYTEQVIRPAYRREVRIMTIVLSCIYVPMLAFAALIVIVAFTS